MKQTSTLTKKQIRDGCQGAHWFEPELYFDDDSQISDIAPELLKILYRYKTYERYRTTTHETAVAIFLKNLLCAYWYTEGWITMPIKPNAYTETHASARIFNELIAHGMIEHGFFVSHVGFNNGIVGRVTRYRITSACYNWLDSKNFTKQTPKYPRPKDRVVLKDPNGREIDVPEELAEQHHLMRENLIHINNALDQIELDIDLTSEELVELNKRLHRRSKEDKDQPLPFFAPTKKYLKRVFNSGSLKLGGRFYGACWQSLPKEYRPRIFIDNESTVEVDYKCLHPRLLYARDGIDFQDDIYHLDGIDPIYRILTKKIFLIIFNADSEKKTINALKRTRILKEHLNGKFPKGVRGYKSFIHLVEKQHPLLKKYFYKGIGLELQNIDSRIAERVMLKMIDVYNSVTLCVHDSFIVKAKYETDLIEVMKEEYTHETGFTCPVETK